MRIGDVMTKDPITVEPTTRLRHAHKLMQDHKIRKLPVIKGGKVVGIVTYDMLLEAAPSPATSLSITEIHYLLAEMTVKDIMARDPMTLSPDTPFEKILILGQDSRVRGFPVVENGKLVGITTHGDIIRLLTRALGLRQGGVRLTIEGLGDRLGELAEIISIFDRHKAPVMSILTLPKGEGNDWVVVIRLNAKDAAAIVDSLKRAGLQATLSNEPIDLA
jgi:acetoin utilization protein AcuB